MLSKNLLPEPVLSALVLACNNMLIGWGYLRRVVWPQSEVVLFADTIIPHLIDAIKYAFEGTDKSNFCTHKMHLFHHYPAFIKEQGAPELTNSGSYEHFHIQ
jgi:hypothetical protein